MGAVMPACRGSPRRLTAVISIWAVARTVARVSSRCAGPATDTTFGADDRLCTDLSGFKPALESLDMQIVRVVGMPERRC